MVILRKVLATPSSAYSNGTKSPASENGNTDIDYQELKDVYLSFLLEHQGKHPEKAVGQTYLEDRSNRFTKQVEKIVKKCSSEIERFDCLTFDAKWDQAHTVFHRLKYIFLGITSVLNSIIYKNKDKREEKSRYDPLPSHLSAIWNKNIKWRFEKILRASVEHRLNQIFQVYQEEYKTDALDSLRPCQADAVMDDLLAGPFREYTRQELINLGCLKEYSAYLKRGDNGMEETLQKLEQLGWGKVTATYRICADSDHYIRGDAHLVKGFGKKKDLQDSIGRRAGKLGTLYWVCDGHGNYAIGDARQTVLASKYLEWVEDKVDPATAFSQAVRYVHEHSSAGEYDKGGYTLTMLYINNDGKLYIHNYGDCRAYVVIENPYDAGSLDVIQASRDHVYTREEEFQRGCQSDTLKPFFCADVNPREGLFFGCRGEFNLEGKRIPSYLQPSRGIEFWHDKKGPETDTFEISNYRNIISVILGSDGWAGCLSLSEISEICEDHLGQDNPVGLSKALVEKAFLRNPTDDKAALTVCIHDWQRVNGDGQNHEDKNGRFLGA